MEKLTIGEVARQAGLQTSAIRYYERIGLLPAPQRLNGKRRYDEQIFRKLGVIQLARRAGFTISDIQSLLHDFPAETPPAHRWQALVPAKIDALNVLIQHALETRTMLEHTLDCQCPTLEDCAAGNQLDCDHDSAA